MANPQRWQCLRHGTELTIAGNQRRFVSAMANHAAGCLLGTVAVPVAGPYGRDCQFAPKEA